MRKVADTGLGFGNGSNEILEQSEENSKCRECIHQKSCTDKSNKKCTLYTKIKGDIEGFLNSKMTT